MTGLRMARGRTFARVGARSGASRALAAACLVLLACAARAETPADFAWVQHPGALLPLHAPLRDEDGRTTSLGALLGGAPVILDLGYFHCPSLCGVVRSDVFAAWGASGLRPGRDVTLVSLSIDPAETPLDAARAKQADLAQASFVRPANLHYLTGSAASLAAMEAALGFRARYDAAFKQFLHPAGLAVLTPSGTVSSYLLGTGYAAGDLRAAVLRAGHGGIAEAALPVLLLCFHFDSTTGRYTLAVEKVLRLGAGLTVLTIAGLLAVLHRRRPPAAG